MHVEEETGRRSGKADRRIIVKAHKGKLEIKPKISGMISCFTIC